MAVIPNTNVNLATNIRDVLNAAGGSVTNDVTTFFKTTANINRYSKKKPIRNSNDFDVTDTDFKNANYGLEINGASGINIGGQWNYLLPRGKTTYNEPYRLGDFRGYNTDSSAPLVKGVDSITWNVFDGSTFTETIFAKYNISGSGQFGGVASAELSIDDLVASNYSSFPLKDMRLVAAFDSSHYAIAENTLGTTGNKSGISSENVLSSTLKTTLDSMAINETKNLYLLLTNGTPSALSWTFPFPVSTYIPIMKIRKFYYQFYPTSCILDWGYTETITLHQDETPKLYSLAMKNNLKAQSSTKSMNITIVFRVYRASGMVGEAISISNLGIITNAYNTYVTGAFTLTVVNYVDYQGTITTIDQQYGAGDSVTFPNSVEYSNSAGYYNVTIEYTGTVETLKSNASANDNLPSSAYFDANWWMRYRRTEMPSDFVVVQPNFRFKFVNG